MCTSKVEIIDRGMRCLSDNLGADKTAVLITTILRERFDYTKWRRQFVDEIEDFDDLDRLVDRAVQKNTKSNSAKVVI